MRVAVVTVGDELLSGETVNTNAAWLGRQLAERGVTVGSQRNEAQLYFPAQ